jgi:lysophospholipase L1-like esterase
MMSHRIKYLILAFSLGACFVLRAAGIASAPAEGSGTNVLSTQIVAPKGEPCETNDRSKDAPKLPKVLIVGDSISGGYSGPLIKLLDGKVTVVKLGAVATYRIQKEAFWHSNGTAKGLDFGSAKACITDFERFEKHLSETKYDLIHFNFGLNDIYRGRKGAWHNPVEQYEKDLEKIVALLKTNGAKIIWANTTPIPNNDPDRPKGDELIYNAAAEKVMKKNNIPINDLHSVVTKWDGYDEWRKGKDVHFGKVYPKLADQIAKLISEQLGLQNKPKE